MALTLLLLWIHKDLGFDVIVLVKVHRMLIGFVMLILDYTVFARIGDAILLLWLISLKL